MSENYKWIQNRKCEFFPCHKGVKEEEFNCLFCYCPLYMLKDKCGGNFKNTSGYKDCSDCLFPHRKTGYDFVMKKMGMVMEVGKGTFASQDDELVCPRAEELKAQANKNIDNETALSSNDESVTNSEAQNKDFKLKDVQEELKKQGLEK